MTTAPAQHAAALEMTWGQKSMLRQLVRDRPPHHFNLASHFAVPDGLSDARLSRIVESVIESHTVLRTRFHWPEDATTGTQSLADAYTVAMGRHVVSGAGAEIDPRTEAAFDFSTDIPVRAYVMESPVGRALRLVFSHIAVDGWGVGLLSAQVHTLLAGGRPVPPRVRPVEPAELSAREQSAGFQARSRRAVALWSECLSRLDKLGPGYGDRLYEGREEPRMSYRVTSTEIYSHVSEVAARYRVTRTAVFLGMLSMAIGLARRVGHVPYIFETANRILPDTQAYVGAMSQPVPCVITLAPTWNEQFRQCFDILLRGVRHGYYDPCHLNQLVPHGSPAPELRFGNHFNYVLASAARNGAGPGASSPWSGVEFREWERPGRYETGVGIEERADCSTINLILDPKVYSDADGVAILETIRVLLRRLAAGGDDSTLDLSLGSGG